MARFEAALEKVGVMRFLIGLVVAALLLGFTSGVSSVTFVQDLGADLDTVKAHTEWIADHDRRITRGELARLDSIEDHLHRLETESDRIWLGIQRQLDRVEAWTSELHCDRFPSRCDPVPRIDGDGP